MFRVVVEVVRLMDVLGGGESNAPEQKKAPILIMLRSHSGAYSRVTPECLYLHLNGFGKCSSVSRIPRTPAFGSYDSQTVYFDSDS